MSCRVRCTSIIRSFVCHCGFRYNLVSTSASQHRLSTCMPCLRYDKFPNSLQLQHRSNSSNISDQLTSRRRQSRQLAMASNVCSASPDVPSASPDVPEAKITKVSTNIERHDYYPDGEDHPTLLLLSWLKATPRALDRFRHIYAARGFNVVTVTSKPFHFIWPKSSEPLAQEICEYLITHTQGPIVVHGLSIGGFIYSSCLLHALENKEVLDNLAKRIQGHVFDSLVAGELQNMAEGVSKGSAAYPTTRYLVQKSIMLYFWLAKQHTIPHYDRGIDVFFNFPLKTPMLLYYSKVDTMCSNEVMRNLVEAWKDKLSLDVTVKVFDDSQHVFHLREHPEEYKEELKKYLDKVQMLCSQQTEVPSRL